MAINLEITLTESDTRFIALALKDLETKWQHLSMNSVNEDEQAEYGNDAADLSLTIERFVEAATKVFGPAILTFDRTPL